MTRLLVADGNDAARAQLRGLLEAQADCWVVAEAVDGQDAILKSIDLRPDIAMINSELPVIGSIEVTRQIRRRLRRTEVLIFAIDNGAAQISRLVKAGARGFLNSSTVHQDLAEAVQHLSMHKPFLTPEVTEELLNSFRERLGIADFKMRNRIAHLHRSAQP